MWLETGDDASALALCIHLGTRSSEHRTDLGRMMRVVVKDTNPLLRAAVLKTAANTCEVCQALSQLSRIASRQRTSQQRSGRVEHHVVSRNVEVIGKLLRSDAGQRQAHTHVRTRRRHRLFHYLNTTWQRRFSARAVAQHLDSALNRALTGGHGLFIFKAHHEVAAVHDAIGEVIKNLVVALRRTEIVQVVGLDIGNHGHGRAIAQQ